MDDYTRRKLLGTGRLAGDAPLDPLSGAVPMTSDLQRDIHAGLGWELFHIAHDVASEGVVLMQLNTGPVGVCLRKIVIWSDASLAKLEMFRNPTLVDGTVAIPIRNLSHVADRALPEGIAAFSNPSGITAPGECYYETMLGGGEEIALGSKAWSMERDVETMLAPNTKYLLRLTNLNGQDRNVSISMIFCA